MPTPCGVILSYEASSSPSLMAWWSPLSESSHVPVVALAFGVVLSSNTTVSLSDGVKCFFPSIKTRSTQNARSSHPVCNGLAGLIR